MTTDKYRNQVLAIERRKIRSWLWKFTHDSSEIEDLQQEVYARLLAVSPDTIAGINERDDLERFVYGVCRHVGVDWVRNMQLARRFQSRLDAAGPLLGAPNMPEVSARISQNLESVRDAINRLPRRQRRVYVLRNLYGYSAKEIAIRVRGNEGTVRRNLYNAVKSLEKMLKQDRKKGGELRSINRLLGSQE